MMGLVGIAIVVTVVLVVWAVSRETVPSVQATDPDRAAALQILRTRLARGAITWTEYVRAKKALRIEG